MKLYYSPGSSSLASHIVIKEMELPVDLHKVDLKTKKCASGADYRLINPKGSVPALELSEGELLTESSAILLYLADLKPELHMAPKPSTFDRIRLIEWLSFVSTELHKSFSPLFGAKSIVPEEEGQKQLKAYYIERIATRFGILEERLQSRPFLMGETFSVADPALFTVLRWSRAMGIEISRWPSLHKFMDRVGARPKVQLAMKTEGLAT
ncbi:MAG: glutathione transferase GstA [Bdellovibrionales bacterium]